MTLPPPALPEARDLRRWLEARRADVDAALERYLPSAPACPPRVGEAMRYSLFAGGKRLRPLLALAAAEAIAAAHRAAVEDARALALFERGVQLSRFCHARLEEAERRVEILNERGETRPAPDSLK